MLSLLAVLAAALPLTAANPGNDEAPRPPPAVPSAHEEDGPARELVLKLREPAEPAPAVIARLAGRTRVPVRYVRRSVAGWHVVRVDAAGAHDTARSVRVVAAQPEVVDVVANDTQGLLRVPDDPYLGDLWGLSLIEAEAAWEVTVGKRGQRLGVVDSGTTRAHRDLQGRVARGWDFISDARRAQDGDGRDADDADDAGRDTQYHGTHVAGVMLARADDGVGVPGLNWRARLVSARVLGRGGRGSLVDIVEGAAWMAGLDVEGVPPIGADQVSVINLSLGSEGRCSGYERDVYDEILARGVVLVAAAGNTGNDTAVGAPANCPGVIAVGAVGPDVALAPYSAFGARIDVLAPGGDDTGDVADWILSLDGGDVDGYRWLFGTSMAAPHVAGVVSLMQAVAPDLEPAMVRDVLQESPWTCEGCDDEALLQADHAVDTALARQRELDEEGGERDDAADDLAGDDESDDDRDPGERATPRARESPADGGGGCAAAPASAGLLALVGVWRRRATR